VFTHSHRQLHSRRSSIVIVILLLRLAGGKPVRLGPSPYTRDNPVRQPTQYTIREGAWDPDQGSHAREGICLTSRHPRSPKSPASSLTAHYLFTSDCFSSSLIKTRVDQQQLLRGRTGPLELYQCEWRGVGIVRRSEQASNVSFEPTQMHYLTLYSATVIFRCSPASTCTQCRSESALIGCLCKTEADWIDPRRRLAEVCSIGITKRSLLTVVVQE
jgi:hypothetical protein